MREVISIVRDSPPPFWRCFTVALMQNYSAAFLGEALQYHSRFRPNSKKQDGAVKRYSFTVYPSKDKKNKDHAH